MRKAYLVALLIFPTLVDVNQVAPSSRSHGVDFWHQDQHLA